jgi:outer membrane protein assembly factor BamA
MRSCNSVSLTFSITRKFVAIWMVLTLISLFAQAREPIDQETQQKPASESPGQEKTTQEKTTQEKTTKEKRGSLIAAPIPISSPAIGSGVVLAGGYIFAPRKSDKISQPSTIAGAVLITDNGSRAWGLGGDFYFKQDTYHITTIYFRGNINYDFYGTGTTSGNAGQKLPLKQTGELFLGDFLYRLRWKVSVGPRFMTGNSNITLRSESENVNGVAAPPDVGIETRLTGLGFHANRDTRPNRFYPEKGTLFDFTSMFFSDALGSKYSFESYRLTFNYYRSFGTKQVLAYNLFNCATAGNAPFYGQCIFGTNNELRGYVAGQYIDTNMIATQLEYRRTLPWRFGMVAFVGVGEVVPGLGEMQGDNLLPAGGAGLRFKISQKYKLNFRFDFAQGKDGHTFGMGIGEAF